MKRPKAANRKAPTPRKAPTRINEMIRVPTVLLIDSEGKNLGAVPIARAQRLAADQNLDLVEISPTAKPPVCRVLDYGKYKYEQEVKAREARKHQSLTKTKEVKFRPKIAVGDYQTKVNHIREFLGERDKVKVTIMFRGREMAHQDLGRDILDRVAKDIAELGIVDSKPSLLGKNMTMMIVPRQQQVSKDKATD